MTSHDLYASFERKLAALRATLESMGDKPRAGANLPPADKTTSARVAGIAGRLLSDPETPADAKAVAGSALAQAARATPAVAGRGCD